MGRWGNEGSFTIQLDRTGPSIKNLMVKRGIGNYQLREGFITNKSLISITFELDNANKDTTCNLPLNDSTNTCTIERSDALGNKTKITRNIWKRDAVIFINKGGTGDGSSWQEASNDLVGVFGDAKSGGKELWVASGQYGADLYTPSTTTALGGFDAATFPVSSDSRSYFNTFVEGAQFGVNGGTLDGFVFSGRVNASTGTVNLKNCQIIGAGTLAATNRGTLNANNILATGLSGGYGLVYVDGDSYLTIDGGSLIGNIPLDGSVAFSIGGTATFKGSLVINGNKTPGSFVQMKVSRVGKLTIEKGVNFDCNQIFKEDGGSGTCDGKAF